LRLEALQQNDAEKIAALPAAIANAEPAARPARRPLPAHLPREVRTYLPKQEACPDCGGELKHLGEDVSEMLEIERALFKVIRQVRPKLACSGCERIVQAEAPSRPIARGVAGPGLLAHVLVSKFGDHLPLYRQSEIYARQGVELAQKSDAQDGYVNAQDAQFIANAPMAQVNAAIRATYPPGPRRPNILEAQSAHSQRIDQALEERMLAQMKPKSAESFEPLSPEAEREFVETHTLEEVKQYFEHKHPEGAR
jgi:transposase